MKKKCELLAPAGGMKQLIAAVENGADAVYLGGDLFNARMNADNFSAEEMKEALDYAHLRGVNIYVTFNTLIKDEELQQALDYAGELYEVGVDGLIVQDFGLGKLIKEYIPDFPLHLSTQGTVYNVSGLKAAKKLGYSRVVPARELSLAEIKELTAANICDIEVFVHGALCICYSGQCQLSRAIGGRSGNRGECAQPCRLAYKDENGKNSYCLSPKDLCMIDLLPELVEAGVTSMKIEGRMKSPEYVAIVTRIYRKYLDKCYEEGEYQVSKEDKQELLQIFNRGGFTEGYFQGNPGQDILSGKLPKHLGIKVGTVVKMANRELIDVKLTAPLEIGDGVEIHSEPLTGNVVTYKKVLENEISQIGDIKGTVKKGDSVYKIVDKKLMKKAQESFRKKGTRNTNIKMTFKGNIGEAPELIVKSEEHEVKVRGNKLIEQAINRSLSDEIVEKQLRKTGDTPFFANGVKLIMEQGCSLPLSELNKLRRDALDLLTEKMTEKRGKLSLPKINYSRVKPKYIELNETYRLPTITKGNCDTYIKEHLIELPNQVIVGNIGWIDELVRAGKTVFAGQGLNIYNEEAQKAIESLGAICVETSMEGDEEPSVLMVTEHPIRAKTLTDRRGEQYIVEKNSFGDKYILKKQSK